MPLYVCDYTDRQLVEIDPVDASGTLVGVLPSSIPNPNGMTWFEDKLWVVGLANRQVRSIENPSTSASSVLHGTLTNDINPWAMVFHDSRLLIFSSFLSPSPSLWEITLSPFSQTRLRNFPSNYNFQSCASFNGRLLAAYIRDPSHLFEITDLESSDANDGLINLGVLPLQTPTREFNANGMAVYHGDLFVSNSFNDSLWYIENPDIPGTAVRIGSFPSGVTAPYGLASSEPEPPEIPLSARISSGTPRITADITVREPALLLSDFDTAGLEIDALALIRASAPPDIYADSDRGGTQTPLDGELGLSLGQTLISRMQTVNVFEQIRFNDNNNPQNLSMSTYFNEGGDGNNLTLYIQTSEGVISQVIADSIVGAGSDWIRIGIDQENRSLIGNISDGDLFIVAFARLETIAVPLSARITSGTPTISADISIREPEGIALSARIVSGAPQIRADVSIRGPGLLLSDFDTTGLEVDALALIEAGIAPDVFGRSPRDDHGDLIDGELGLSSTEEPINAIRFRDSGSLAGGERISLHDNGLLPLSTYFGSDGDGMDLSLWVQTSEGSISFPVDGNIDRSGGNFVIFNVPSEHQSFVESIEEDERFILAFTRQVSVDIPLSARIVSGTPTISADISIREPGEIPLSSRIVSGIPQIRADITIIEPEDIALSARIVSGVPQIRADITIRELEDITLSARIVSGSPIIRADISVITQVIVSSLFDRRASLLSVEIDNALLDHVLKTSTYNRPSGLSLGLSDRLPTLDNLFDISGGGYARQVINSGWTNAINRAIAFGNDIDFPTATQNQGTVSYFNITLNDILAIYGELDDPRVIFSGDQISINDDDLDISFNTRGGASDYLSNKLLDFLLRGANLPPPSSIYIALCSDSIDDDDTGDSIPELSGLGYSRILHNDWNDSEDRLSTNDGQIQFPRATGNWDIVVEYALIDSSNNGNLLMHRPFGSSVIVKDNDRLSFSDGELPIQLGPVFARAGLSSSSDEIGRGIIRGY